MKVLCIKPLEHIGVQSYIQGQEYDFTPEQWEELKKLRKIRVQKRRHNGEGYL